ncbi:MAG: hypothetical protein JW929_09840 [Anaerolineales bacterium]|nr:hypothetical protein [Anaerolineales bacterium]
MRKIITATLSILIGVCCHLLVEEEVAKAQGIDYCKKPEIKITDPFLEGYWDYSATKDGPAFVLDYYQDPGLTGVDITVTIQTAQLTATYWKWEDVCQPYEEYHEGEEACTYDGEPMPGFDYAYITRTCVQQPPEKTYRSIIPSSLYIWLDLSLQTRDLLGPGPYFGGSKTPVLRYLYPDQWAVIVARPGDMIIVEGPGFSNPEDVTDFLKKNKDYLVLESDTKSYLVGTRMPLSYWSMMKYPAIALVNNGNCVAGQNRTGMDAGMTALAGGEGICVFEKKAFFNNALNEYKITMRGIPLDLPGEWYIGVSFWMESATFDRGNGREPDVPEEILAVSSEDQERRYSFESYIIRSAPCNPQEPGSCWDPEGGE